MGNVRAKKNLGQHFLKDLNIAKKIVDSLQANQINKVLEIGPGMGVLTQYLLPNKSFETHVVEIDTESVAYLKEKYPELDGRIIGEDFLRYDLSKLFDEPFVIIGNFPYNISSQIFFRVLDYRDQIPEVVCMIQKEVAERMSAKPNCKAYGILSVLMQAFYNIDYLFTVGPEVFNPPPKVNSGVIRMSRNTTTHLECNEPLFIRVVKTGFNQRRKTLRNSLKSLLGDLKLDDEVMGQRPEQLSVQEFVELTNKIDALLAK
ncbi:16S rRNA (adenine(1518)-N(6)/adenine(1519)-N(6))-dimethyltransferase RsmA [Ancylomarina euxinus]|uniref:Ribosomal RNA small subunit methyltransferase A n=1 Tax=Ancylomarina euxinus TaxID=2283627 RepID=A0A425Y8I6_9BACT|nr:16S rRNA (adenine(1518)-N(6)/adenine(1519)-N(6))-dimethyltransferase RsmA [Ancylomarina euxinus]MCZ4693328.1 16S rRNA (adenine(1518)-N(6)/adenine(1519)-N(6))-dimethyltransferase RsmA [Ancylomarina euxinus]MUP13556.1 16S rRNA (adenine(1518)-N(6)/adenine(1519)-N(6))-dimethyltransferase RsmA [Ancylomarina euxinus]RRG24796.1 16S rRNA (adenine(1518)-N(6)/adenine(1519)-N(6))-dimethyltransferase RsmA [Ancylomarina euxinus]